jgi:hypothetical protein
VRHKGYKHEKQKQPPGTAVHVDAEQQNKKDRLSTFTPSQHSMISRNSTRDRR